MFLNKRRMKRGKLTETVTPVDDLLYMSNKDKYDTLGKMYPTMLGVNNDKDYQSLFGAKRESTSRVPGALSATLTS